MSGQHDTPEQREKTRVDYSQPVRIRYRRFQDFIQEVSTNISRGGMFIASDEPREPGTELEFELALEDGFTLIAGRGEVVWVRQSSEGAKRPSGMGIRFLELRGASRRLLDKIVEKRSRERARRPPRDTEPTAALSTRELRAAAARRLSDETETMELRSVPEAKGWRGSLWLRLPVLVAAAAAAGGLVVLLFHLLWVQPKIRDLERRVELLANISERETEEGSADGAETAVAGAVEVEDAEIDLDPLGTVMAWARAWSEGRVEEYLGFYDEAFTPPGGASRDEWEAIRRGRIARQSEISVRVLMPEVDDPGDGTAMVRFVQSYESSTYRDRVRKTIGLARGEEGWRIVSEEVIRALPD